MLGAGVLESHPRLPWPEAGTEQAQHQDQRKHMFAMKRPYNLFSAELLDCKTSAPQAAGGWASKKSFCLLGVRFWFQQVGPLRSEVPSHAA